MHVLIDDGQGPAQHQPQLGLLLGRAAASKPLAFIASPPPGQDPGLAASIRHRLPQPGRGIAGVMGTNDRADRIGAYLLLR